MRSEAKTVILNDGTQALFHEGSQRGRALYGKMGFQPWGELPNGIRRSDGTVRRLIYMRKALD